MDIRRILEPYDAGTAFFLIRQMREVDFIFVSKV